MNGYALLLFLHVVSVIVWLGAGTTLALLGVYARGHDDRLMLQRLRELPRWIGPRVFAPASFGALGFGLALMADGHWGVRLWIVFGLAAFLTSAGLNAGVRFPLERRLARGGPDRERTSRVLVRLPLLELTVLYLTVADMVAKPTVSSTGTLAAGGAILALALAAVLTALLPSAPSKEVTAR